MLWQEEVDNLRDAWQALKNYLEQGRMDEGLDWSQVRENAFHAHPGRQWSVPGTSTAWKLGSQLSLRGFMGSNLSSGFTGTISVLSRI